MAIMESSPTSKQVFLSASKVRQPDLEKTFE